MADFDRLFNLFAIYGMNQQKVLKKLSELVAIRSISTDKKYHKQILEAAGFIKKELINIGFQVNMFEQNNCPPLIIARYRSKNTSKNKKTIGVYAHYDIQPEDPIDKWQTPPFQVTVQGNRIYGRGTADDKGHLIQSIVAAEELVKNNSLTNDIVFLFEGEEESESLDFETLIKKHRRLLNDVDVFYILDSGMKDKGIPQIFYGLRGIAAFELSVRVGSADLHSGVYGNKVLNPVSVVSELISKIKDEKGKIGIPGFYDKMRERKNKEKELLSEYVLSNDRERKIAGVFELVGDHLSSKLYPSFDVNGIEGGYTGRGFKTVIPSEVIVKFSFRLVEDQKADEIKKSVTAFIESNLPKGVRYELKFLGGADPFFTDYDNLYVKRTKEILTQVFGHKTLLNRSGGSIPASEILQRIFNKPIIITGFTLPDENIHAPNENIDIDMFFQGIEALKRIFCQ
ncbi:hypothetical protein B6D29_02575 [Microgenomates bacterium UTCPR1]|nr:MAG: hypothetical protein B6D29_02575 [Microgenomates bacterium UTCPR1]